MKVSLEILVVHYKTCRLEVFFFFPYLGARQSDSGITQIPSLLAHSTFDHEKKGNMTHIFMGVNLCIVEFVTRYIQDVYPVSVLV